MNQRGFIKIFVIIGIVIVVGVTGFLIWNRQKSLPKPTPSESSPAPTPITQITEISETAPVTNNKSDWKTYCNDLYGFELQYPSDWEVKNLQSYGGWDDSVFYIQDKDGLSIHILRIEKTSVPQYIQSEVQRLKDYEEFIKNSEGVGVHQFLGDEPKEVTFAGRNAALQENLEALGFAGSVIAFPVEGLLIQVNKYQLVGNQAFSPIPDDIMATLKFVR